MKKLAIGCVGLLVLGIAAIAAVPYVLMSCPAFPAR